MIFGYLPTKLPYIYLGFPMGSDMDTIDRRKIEDRFKINLCNCKVKMLSISGRLTLLNSMLGNLSIYYMSLFMALVSIIKTIELYCACFFFWGGDSDNKISWLKWEVLILDLEKGGLGV